jgi:hypothetical protein
MKLENRLRNGYNGAKSGRGTLLGAMVLFVLASEQTGQKATRDGFRQAQGKQNPNYGKTVIQLGKKLGVIVPKIRSSKGTVYALGPHATEFLQSA